MLDLMASMAHLHLPALYFSNDSTLYYKFNERKKERESNQRAAGILGVTIPDTGEKTCAHLYRLL